MSIKCKLGFHKWSMYSHWGKYVHSDAICLRCGVKATDVYKGL